MNFNFVNNVISVINVYLTLKFLNFYFDLCFDDKPIFLSVFLNSR